MLWLKISASMSVLRALGRRLRGSSLVGTESLKLPFSFRTTAPEAEKHQLFIKRRGGQGDVGANAGQVHGMMIHLLCLGVRG